ncbi:MAG: alpha/beta fold hydrolase [Anaerolineales bacterium]
MPTVIDPRLLTFGNWTFRMRPSQADAKGLIILLHGWMGDENSMWVLARNLSPNYVILAPRAPFAVPEGGYSWRVVSPGTWGSSSLEDLRSSAQTLVAFIEDWSASAGLETGQFDLMGFSQGAAMAYALALLYPQRVRRLAALAGFIPEGGETLFTQTGFWGKAIFVTHGRQDDTIPVEHARQAVVMLRKAGAQVTYCESDTGHKVGGECLKELEIFLGKF